MTEACHSEALAPNLGSDTSVGIFRHPCRSISAVLRAAHGLWRPPLKPAAELAVRAGVELRTAERWVYEGRGLSADALADLIRSDAGLHFVEALMSEATPAWWRSFKRASERADLRRRQNELRKQLERLDEAEG